MRGEQSSRKFDIVLLTEAVLIALACALVFFAYLGQANYPMRHTQALALAAAMASPLSLDGQTEALTGSADALAAGLREREERLSTIFGEARHGIHSDLPMLSSLSQPSTPERRMALEGFRGGSIEPNWEKVAGPTGERAVLRLPLRLDVACASCGPDGGRLEAGSVVGLRELDIPLVGGDDQMPAKLLAACAMMAVALIVYFAVIIPAFRRNRQQTTQIVNVAKNLEQQAITDPLTGLHNRRYFEEALQEYLRQFSAIGCTLGLLVFDIDHFKSVNDNHGHDAGDLVLREVGLRLRAITRERDVVARIGGEEFAVITPYMNKDQILMVAERYRKMIEALRIDLGKVVLRPTVSIGVATNSVPNSTVADMFKDADRKLYDAKRAGRNRVVA